jgi:hypothetical protein
MRATGPAWLHLVGKEELCIILAQTLTSLFTDKQCGVFSTQHQLSASTFARTDKTKHYIVFLRSVRRLLVTANVVPSSPIRHPDEGGGTSGTFTLTRATQRNIPEDGILHISCVCCMFENFKSKLTKKIICVQGCVFQPNERAIGAEYSGETGCRSTLLRVT